MMETLRMEMAEIPNAQLKITINAWEVRPQHQINER